MHNPAQPESSQSAPLRTLHTPNFPALPRDLGSYLLVTTYQAGKLVMVRDEEDHLNAHFHVFQAPMGMALEGNRLAIGTTIQVWVYVTYRLSMPHSSRWSLWYGGWLCESGSGPSCSLTRSPATKVGGERAEARRLRDRLELKTIGRTLEVQYRGARGLRRDRNARPALPGVN